MLLYQKILLWIFTFVCFTVVFYMLHQSSDLHFYRKGRLPTVNDNKTYHLSSLDNIMTPVNASAFHSDIYNVWCIFTKVNTNAPLKLKFKTFLTSLLKYSKSKLRLNLISDNSSLPIAKSASDVVMKLTGKHLDIVYYDVLACANEIEDIVSAMKPHFSSQPGTYYSDSLFFLSLGLHRFAKDQHRAVLFDVDIKLQADVADIFQEFNNFPAEALFGLAPELTPVYRHVLYSYRSQHPHTRFGDPDADGGIQGVNSGVVLLDLDRMRQSDTYRSVLQSKAVSRLADKYSFKGHLGDQDFYTLLLLDWPALVHVLPCGWNRQLCTWWRDHGYKQVFDRFHRCDQPIRAFHGNCNTHIPDGIDRQS